MNIERGDIYYIRPHLTTGAEIWSGRPAIVVSNDRINHTSNTVEVVYLTTQPKEDCATHVTIRSSSRESVALCEQISTVALERIGTYAGHVTGAEMAQLEIAMMISLAISCAAAPVQAEEKQDPVYPPREAELQAELAAMTTKYETIKSMYNSLLVTLLQQPK